MLQALGVEAPCRLLSHPNPSQSPTINSTLSLCLLTRIPHSDNTRICLSTEAVPLYTHGLICLCIYQVSIEPLVIKKKKNQANETVKEAHSYNPSTQDTVAEFKIKF